MRAVERSAGSEDDGAYSRSQTTKNGVNMAAADVPQYNELIYPTLLAVGEEAYSRRHFVTYS